MMLETGQRPNVGRKAPQYAVIWTMVLGMWGNSANAISFLSFDARSLSMAGTGVVTARSHNASLFNPALLINHDPKRLSRLHAHTYIGARLLDRDNFLQAADEFSDRYEGVDLEELIMSSVVLDTPDFESGAELREATTSIRNVQRDINHLSDKPLRVSASYGASFGYPAGQWAIGGYHRQFLVMGSMVRVSERDNASIDRVTNTVDRFADLLDEVMATEAMAENSESLTLEQAVAQVQRLWDAVRALNEYVDFDALYDDAVADQTSGKGVQDYLREPLPQEFYSTIESRGAEVTEQALSVARSFLIDRRDRLHFGITLKQVHFTTIHFEQPVNEFELDVYSEEVHRREYTRFNMDAGLVHDLPGPWQWGVVVRNLVPHDFTTALGDRIRQRPVARVGLGFRTEPFRISVDWDLTRNEPLGFDPDKQYLSVGTEWFLWRNTALRAGLRHNVVDAETLPSVGLGLGGRRAHLDIGAAKSTNGDEWGLALQAGLSF
ncbi:conjugal transfer protein TraF [Marinimicrobium sp. C6131]|uniref:conjugal transfer protein TraF n=1 Tax=Marinimicrobium sp. C6131 TaxID=3022676 RepID=UPI00223DC30D|nr:conjugal transfer protein TraF [Marinimicrobium sp. C6131]UZJ45802.1 conjugal transfer protein TraF [Marinimicrobium sp. C6131]